MIRLLFILSLVSGLAEAAKASDEGMAAADTVCQNAGFQSDILKCTKIASQAQYFEKSAVELCSNVGFKSDVIQCLTVIRDKSYPEQLIATCRGMGFATKIIECLENSGKSVLQKVQLEKIEGADAPTRSLVAQALKHLESGHTQEAKAILSSLLIKLSE